MIYDRDYIGFYMLIEYFPFVYKKTKAQKQPHMIYEKKTNK